MKKIVFLSIFILVVSICSFGQDSTASYKKWAIEGEIGFHDANDETSLMNNNLLYLGAGVRYNFNPNFALGVTGGFNDLSLNDFNYVDVNTKLFNVNVEAYANLSNWLKLPVRKNKPYRSFILLAHAGPGVSYFKVDDDYDEIMFNARVGLRGMFRLWNSWAVYVDVTSTGNMYQKRTLDNSDLTSNGPMNSIVNTASLGLTWYPKWGKKRQPITIKGNKSRKHNDWLYSSSVVNNYYPTEVVRRDTTIYRDTTIIEIRNEDDRMGAFLLDEEYEEQRYIQFSNGKHDILQHAYSKINDVLFLLEDSTCVVSIEAWASATGTNTPKDNEWNFQLSKRRASEVAKYLTKMGISENRINKVAYYGKDFEVMDPEVQGLARKVRIRVYRLKAGQKAPWENPNGQ